MIDLPMRNGVMGTATRHVAQVGASSSFAETENHAPGDQRPGHHVGKQERVHQCPRAERGLVHGAGRPPESRTVLARQDIATPR